MSIFWLDPKPGQNYAPITRRQRSEQRCRQCGRWYPLTANHWRKSNHNPLGYDYTCKRCRRAYNIQRRVRRGHTELPPGLVSNMARWGD